MNFDFSEDQEFLRQTARSFFRYFGRADCAYYGFTPNEAVCLSAQAQYGCTNEYFYAPGLVCYLSGCLCGV